MQTSLRLGRLGGLTIYLNYTWIFSSVLILWWVALLWLPEHFPAWGTNMYWLVAVAVLALYLMSVIAHELAHSVVAQTKPHSVNLFPFGGAVPFRLKDITPGRALFGALAGPFFNLALGGVLLLIAGAIPGPEHVLGWLKAVLVPLGWLNIWLGAVNLIPGTPFDGGLVLAAAQYSFTGDRESGLALSQTMGRAATLVLVLLGAWRGLTSDQWLQALALVVIGWSAREAAALGQQRRTIRALLSQMKASDFMESTRPEDSIGENATVAELVRAHPRFSPHTPLPLVNADGDLVGITTLAATERLMQGTWPTTPVRAIAKPLSGLQTVGPYTSLVDVLAIAQARHSDIGAAPASPKAPGMIDVVDGEGDDTDIPVVQDNKLVGSIDLTRLQSFEEAGRQFGVEETLGSDTNGGKSRGVWGRLSALIPAFIVLAAMAILGNIALRTDPIALQEVQASSDSAIVFSNFTPADGDIVGLGQQGISVQVEGASAIVSATIMIDGQPLDTQIAGALPLTQTASATSPGLTLGQHTARITASTEKGDSKSSQWKFRVDPRVANTPIAGATPSVNPTAATVPAAAPLQIARYKPSLGGRVQSGVANLTLSADVIGPQKPTEARFSLDGKNLDTKIEQVSGADNVYRVSAIASPAGVGLHVVRVEVTGGGGGANSASWVFSALQPDANNAYFKETGYFVTQPFLKYWQENGELGLFGYPISDLVQETDKATGEVYTAQYFERARFEQHPSLGDAVALGRLGALIQPLEPAVSPKDGAQFFKETGHNVSPTLLKYWNENGGLAVFGYPITEERTEKNPIDGKEYTVQYFERNRFELHPEKAGTPFEVQLGLLGAQIYMQKYGQ